MGIEQVEVPDLSGKTESEAKTAISNAKLKWKSTEKISYSSKPNGVVVNQSISNGSMVDKNTEITITINEFDEIKTGTVNVNVKSLIFNKKIYDRGPKIVVIGGGNGLNTVLVGMKRYTDNITAIVAVSEYGKDPTVSRSELGTALPFEEIKDSIVALSADTKGEIDSLLNHKMENARLKGLNFAVHMR